MKKLISITLGLMVMATPVMKAESPAISSSGLVGTTVLTAGAVALAAGCYNVMVNRSAIQNIKKELRQANSMKSHAEAIIELYNWNTAQYPTARTVKGAEQHCVDGLVADAMSGKLVGIKPDDFAGYNGQLHWSVANGISERLDYEITVLNTKLDQLLPYISGGYIFETLDQLFFYEDSEYKFCADYCQELERACQTAGANVNDPSTWNAQQEAQIDQFMQTQAVSTYTKYLKGYINYNEAAKLYWDTFKKRCRLQAIKQALIKDIRFLNARQQQQPAIQVNVR